MSAEFPLIVWFTSKFPNAELGIAAFAGLATPIAFFIEAPVLSFLSASTTLSRDRQSFLTGWRQMMLWGLGLTIAHLLVSTGLGFDLVYDKLLHGPANLRADTQLALLIFTPFTWSVGYRRFYYGLLIRFKRSKAVALGTLTRLTAVAITLQLAALLDYQHTASLGAAALTMGVIAEAIFSRIVAQKVLATRLPESPSDGNTSVSRREFNQFYLPLAAMSILAVLHQPIGSAALSRMPDSISALALWPVVHNAVFIVRCCIIALNETILTSLAHEDDAKIRKNFVILIISLSFTLFSIFAISPLSHWWLTQVAGFDEAMTHSGRLALLASLLLPILNGLSIWSHAHLLHARRTHVSTLANIAYVCALGMTLLAFVYYPIFPGAVCQQIGFTLGLSCQALVLFIGYRKTVEAVR